MKKTTYVEDKAYLEQLYLVEHKTMQEIGAILGMSRQGVLYQLKKHCVDRNFGERFPVGCDWCGVAFEISRGRWKRSRKHYCSRTCRDQAAKGKRTTTTTKAPAGAEKKGKTLMEVFDDPLVAAMTEGCPSLSNVDRPSEWVQTVDGEEKVIPAGCGHPACTDEDKAESGVLESGSCYDCPPLNRERARDAGVAEEMSKDPPNLDLFLKNSRKEIKGLGQLFGFRTPESDPCFGCPSIEDCPGECDYLRGGEVKGG